MTVSFLSSPSRELSITHADILSRSKAVVGLSFDHVGLNLRFGIFCICIRLFDVDDLFDDVAAQDDRGYDQDSDPSLGLHVIPSFLGIA